MDNGYEFLTTKEEIWAKVLMEVLRDNKIPAHARPVNGAGFSIRTGLPDVFAIYVPEACVEAAKNLADELFSENAVEMSEE